MPLCRPFGAVYYLTLRPTAPAVGYVLASLTGLRAWCHIFRAARKVGLLNLAFGPLPLYIHNANNHAIAKCRGSTSVRIE